MDGGFTQVDTAGQVLLDLLHAEAIQTRIVVPTNEHLESVWEPSKERIYLKHAREAPEYKLCARAEEYDFIEEMV